MAIKVASFFLPATPAVPFILEDVQLRGGYRVVADSVTRDAIKPLARKAGMIVVTQDTGTAWQLLSDNVTWKEASLGGSNIVPIAPMYYDVNGDLGIDTAFVLPAGGSPGNVLTKDVSGSASWQASQSAGVGTRTSTSYIPVSSIAPGSFDTFKLSMAKSLILLRAEVDAVAQKIEAFSTAARNEANPYVFISRPGKLFDDGTSVTSGGNLAFERRYSILSNLEGTPSDFIYWRITNQSNFPVTPTLSLTYLILE